MQTITAGTLPQRHLDGTSNWLSEVGVRLRRAWADRRAAPREIVADRTPRPFVQADIAAFVGVAMRLD